MMCCTPTAEVAVLPPCRQIVQRGIPGILFPDFPYSFYKTMLLTYTEAA
jgi:hypothetical protein